MPTYYRVTITGAEAAAPRDGFVDHTTIEQYRAMGQTVTSLSNALAKERANIRYLKIVEFLQQLGNVRLTNLKADNDDGGPGTPTFATANNAAPEFSFTAVFEHGDEAIAAEDFTEPGWTVTGIDAIRQQIALALCYDHTVKGFIVDPTTDGGLQRAARSGTLAFDVVADQVYTSLSSANAAIAITKIETV